MVARNALYSGQVPYGDLIRGARGDSIVSRDANGQVTGVTVTGQSEEAPEPYNFTGSPGYQFRYNEGLRAIENGLIGRGLGLSGRAVKEAERFGQNYAADEFNAEFARNATLAGFTPPSIGSMNSLIGNFANNASNIAGIQGQIGANSAYNSANINNNMMNNMFQALGQFMPQQYYNPNYGSPYAADGYGPPAWGP